MRKACESWHELDQAQLATAHESMLNQARPVGRYDKPVADQVRPKGRYQVSTTPARPKGRYGAEGLADTPIPTSTQHIAAVVRPRGRYDLDPTPPTRPQGRYDHDAFLVRPSSRYDEDTPATVRRKARYVDTSFAAWPNGTYDQLEHTPAPPNTRYDNDGSTPDAPTSANIQDAVLPPLIPSPKLPPNPLPATPRTQYHAYVASPVRPSGRYNTSTPLPALPRLIFHHANRSDRQTKTTESTTDNQQVRRVRFDGLTPPSSFEHFPSFVEDKDSGLCAPITMLNNINVDPPVNGPPAATTEPENAQVSLDWHVRNILAREEWFKYYYDPSQFRVSPESDQKLGFQYPR
ncbi:hypothetical protein CPC08DRAFT_730128 [Agrocybe pediades]|nr:hypothetical protein CPC08DRAFT_730128 [Agrocybe pediades]